MLELDFLIHNTFSGKLEPFRPLKPGKVDVYVCGPTVYDDPHIGHLRSAFVFDVLRRVLSRHYSVNFVRNVTDIDDKIIAKSSEEKISVQAVAEKYLKLYHADLARLGIAAPTHEPKATASIDGMIRMIDGLIGKGLAYAAGGSVYFNVRCAEDYGALSHQNVDQMLENWRQEPDESKKESLDFALWKNAKPGEPSWDSPWGKGRPGWHIECSVMSAQYCGEHFDIHGGGKDLLFPHHENERAQSMGYSGKAFANVWMHHGLVMNEGQKMSKSLKNFVRLQDVEARYPLDVLRLFYLQSHYSQDADFSWSKMDAAATALKSIYILFEKTSSVKGDGDTPDDYLSKAKEEFVAEMHVDLNTPKALAVLFDVLHEANRRLSTSDTAGAARVARWIESTGELTGLFGEKSWEAASIPAVLEKLLQLRDRLRREKKYVEADDIRKALVKIGVDVEDTPQGSKARSFKNVPQSQLEELLKAKS